jgi:hypothetical protein
MSAYNQSPEMRRRGRPKRAAPTIIPHALIKSANPNIIDRVPGENCHLFAESLRNNSGPAIAHLGALLNPEQPYKFERIEIVTPVLNKDGSVIFMEIRIVRHNPLGSIPSTSPNNNLIKFQRDPTRTKVDKEYKHIFMGDKIWPLDDQGQERTERSVFCSTTSVLMNVGLFIPTNSPAALEHLRRYRKELGEYHTRLSAFKASQYPTYERDPQAQPAAFPEQQPPTPIFLVTEGEKARLGVESYLNLDDPEILSLLEEYNVEITTLGVLAGMPGAMRTNFSIRPLSQDFVVNGVNDEVLECALAQWIIIRDNDNDGIKEALAMANTLNLSFNVPANQIRIANPPVNVKPKWDDADPLPSDMKPVDRLKQILDTKSMLEQYVLRQTGKGRNEEWEVDPTDHNNKRLAIKRISTTIFDEQSTCSRYFEIPDTHLNGSIPLSESEVLYMATLCLRDMGHRPLDSMLRKSDWEPVFTGRFEPPIETRNFIYEELMRDIERGQFILNNAPDKEYYNPETYLLDAFSLPDTSRNRLVSKILIRDFLAIGLRPYLDRNPIIPQVLFVLHGEEGIGKSEFCKVLAGGKPGSESFTQRYTNSVDIKDLQTIGDRSMASFANKVKGRMVVEFPDKALGDSVSISQNGMLNDLANLSQVEFREPYKLHTALPRQFVIIFTTNREDLMGHNMGRRRWVIVDTNQSMKDFSNLSNSLRDKKGPLTETEEIIALGHNPGILKNYHKRAATLAFMYNSNEWKGSLTVPPELTMIMEEERERFTPNQNWELVLQEEMLREPEGEAGGTLATKTRMVLSTSLFAAVKERTGREPPNANYGSLMKSLGYKNYKIHKKNVRGWSKADNADNITEFSKFRPSAFGQLGYWYFCTDPMDLSGVNSPRTQVDPETFQ